MKKHSAFSEFEKLVEAKYGLKYHKFDTMDPVQRNLRLKQMMSKDSVIVFPDN